MAYYVYVLQSLKDFSYYKGYTENIVVRLERHNNGESRYTRTKMPWKLVYLQELPTKRDALIRERQLKRFNSDYLAKIIFDYQQSVG